MSAKIRLKRLGKKGNPYYHIVVADSRASRDGKYIEQIGSYDPTSNPAIIILNNEKALKWLSKGAQPTDTAKAILSYKGVMFKQHLQKGVVKGALTTEQAEEKFNAWLADKEHKINEKRSRVITEKKKSVETSLEAESKKKEERAEMVRKKNIPPPVEEVTAETATATEVSAEEAAAPETPPATEGAETTPSE